MDVYRTLVTVEVFSRGPFYVGALDEDPFGLQEINYAITEGLCIGDVEVEASQRVPPEQIKDHLLRIGNDGTFFEEYD